MLYSPKKENESKPIRRVEISRTKNNFPYLGVWMFRTENNFAYLGVWVIRTTESDVLSAYTRGIVKLLGEAGYLGVDGCQN